MATKRLIDSNALKKAILEEPWKDQPNMVRLTVDYINIIVDEQPTVDAVEVVRCKDCKGYDHTGDFCEFWNGVRHPEHFCGEGERKDNV